jgi:MFS family permease
VLSAILIHMVPLMTTLGLGTAGLIVSTLFGPAQVASRFINMLFGGRLPQRWLAVIAASLLPLGLLVLLATNPAVAGAVMFAILFGFGSGLTSIVGGTLPLELFGREGYGSRLGWVAAARQFTSALAPFALSWMIARAGPVATLSALVVVGAAGVIAFAAIVVRVRKHESASSGEHRVRASA